jgi:hypothetical protein
MKISINITKKVVEIVSFINSKKISIFRLEFKRKLYKRGSSFETTIPKPLLFKLNLEKKNNVVFKYDQKKDVWYIDFEEEKS